MVDKQIQAILDSIEGSISDFQKGIPGIQKGMLDKLLEELKGLQVRDGKILNSVDNLKMIGAIKNKLERLIISQGYKDSVKDFVQAFDTVAGLQNQYFAQFNAKYKPSKTLPIMQQMAVDTTVNGLLGQGLSANIVDRVGSILQTNITTGGSYASLNDQLRASITGTGDTEGMLERYSKTITTDAINQYSAQYHETIATDLQFNWGRYVGSNITTTREFCLLLEEKEWVHRSELPAVVKGDIDGHQCKLSKSTGLPLGMIPGTDANNFKVRRGGYNCGHQFFWVPDSAVPDAIKNRIAKKPEEKKPEEKKQKAKSVPPVPASKKPEQKTTDIGKAVIKKNAKILGEFEKQGISVPEHLFHHLGHEISFGKSREDEAFYSNPEKKIVIGDLGQRLERSEYLKKTLLVHETGHAIHNSNGIIVGDKIRDDFATHFKDLQSTIAGKGQQIHDALKAKLGRARPDDIEQLTVLSDILGSLTKGKFGGGHKLAYYETAGKPEAEVFAHAVALVSVKNKFEKINPDMQEVIRKMKEYMSKVL